ncbi:F-actin capping protein alpha subunit [Russula earlei]|uniref:F-actin capping protein alpha subunit n=1 Tax=Russula earlei TaxID=71964 RepID=A0ACC0U583_9AGAM|nr:F-actin capping protein alpha subunit [Russula earlei]
MTAEEHIQAASKFLLQSPPGEINDVLNDVRVLIGDDESLETGVLPALRQYNLEQLTVAEVPGAGHGSIVSIRARTTEEEDRFIDPRSKTSFIFDHLSLVRVAPTSEPFRSALEASTLQYLSSHYNDGTASVFATPDNEKCFIIQIVANKYNPVNFWSGRWRSEYVVDLEARTITGQILVNVHYYEQGNVQLETRHQSSITLPTSIAASAPSASTKKVLALIADQEGAYQESLGDTYHEMGEKTFKGLRRALPLTRQKLDWDKVLGYKLGAELSSSKGVFGGSGGSA